MASGDSERASLSLAQRLVSIMESNIWNRWTRHMVFGRIKGRVDTPDPTDYALCQPFCMINGAPFVNLESLDVFPVPEGDGIPTFQIS